MFCFDEFKFCALRRPRIEDRIVEEINASDLEALRVR